MTTDLQEELRILSEHLHHSDRPLEAFVQIFP